MKRVILNVKLNFHDLYVNSVSRTIVQVHVFLKRTVAGDTKGQQS